jgi:hypothetical protein
MNDLNTRLQVYLCNVYGIPQASARADLTSLITRNLAGRTGEYTARFQAMIAAAKAVDPVGNGRQALQGYRPLVVVA